MAEVTHLSESAPTRPVTAKSAVTHPVCARFHEMGSRALHPNDDCPTWQLVWQLMDRRIELEQDDERGEEIDD